MVDKDGNSLVDTSQFITGEWSEKPVSYNTRDLLIYAVGIGCGKESRTGHNSNHSDIRYLYEQRSNFAAFPTFPVVLAMKGDTQDIDTVASSDMYLGKNRSKLKKDSQKPRLKLKGVRAAVDAERYIERVMDIPIKNIPKMKIRNRVIGIHNKGSGALVESESELVGEDGTVYYKFSGGGFHIGAYGFKGSGRTNSMKVITPNRTPDAVVELVTTPEQAHIYRLSGDYNPLHIDPKSFMVKAGGFPAPILHGLCTLGHSARAVLLAMANNDPRRFHALKLRFASPVIPGDVLVTKMWKLSLSEAGKFQEPVPQDLDRIVFVTQVKSSGKVVIKNSFMDVFKTPHSRL